MWMEAGALAGAAGLMAYAVRGRSATLLAASHYRGNSGRRSIALTFDDGPTPGTRKILDILERYQVRATFFQVGMQVRRWPLIAREVAERGHEIGNHSDSHPYFCFKSPAFMRTELERAQQSILDATGRRPVWFRAPYGIRWFGMQGAQRNAGLSGVMWTVVGREWKLCARDVRDRVLRSASNGAIICLHDGRGAEANPHIRNTIHAVKEIVPRLLREGYRFETVTELLCTTN
jgi:peptidoglycan-N-acetylglucosamine deacetylase